MQKTTEIKLSCREIEKAIKQYLELKGEKVVGEIDFRIVEEESEGDLFASQPLNYVLKYAYCDVKTKK